MDLFSYPNSPGYKRRGTSADAARDMKPKARTLRDKVFAAIRDTSGLTADEACRLADVSLLAGRPRISELVKLGKIVDSGRRRALESGKMGIVWIERTEH